MSRIGQTNIVWLHFHSTSRDDAVISLFYTVNTHTMAFIYPFSSFTLCIDLRHVYYLYNNVVLAMTMPI